MKRLQKSMHTDGKIKCLYLFEDTKIMGKLFGFRLQRAAPHFFTVQLYESILWHVETSSRLTQNLGGKGSSFCCKAIVRK